MMPIRERKGLKRAHCDRCTMGAMRSGEDDEEATELAQGEGFQKWAGPGSPWKWLCPWCVWEVGLPDEAHQIIKQMLETVATKGYTLQQLAWLTTECQALGIEPPGEEA